jgi:hypothetical protein
LLEDVYDIYFGKTIEEIKAQISNKKGKRAATAAISSAKGLHGSLLEVISTMIANSLGENMKRSGQGKQKVDTYVITAEVELPTVNGIIGESIRKEAIEKMEKFYE